LRKLAPSREQARRLIAAGQVTVDGLPVVKPGALVRAEASLAVAAQPRFVSRGGDKLDAALDRFGLDVAGLVCADVGASTGGFTDCLLQRGAARVYAIDVGHNLLADALRRDPRVVVMEKVNARHLERLPEPVGLATIDASFISLKLLLPVVAGWFASPLTPSPSPLSGAANPGEGGGAPQAGRGARLILPLIKPQFEAGRRGLGKRGVVRDPEVHRRVLLEIVEFAATLGLGLAGLMASRVAGPKGNVEFLAWFMPGPTGQDVPAAVEAALREAPG
jgi:23S rRNA (cytidine1920-2'-O)/16S rRNA (cytidine1409-2'-O)-methyltransferase